MIKGLLILTICLSFLTVTAQAQTLEQICDNESNINQDLTYTYNLMSEDFPNYFAMSDWVNTYGWDETGEVLAGYYWFGQDVSEMLQADQNSFQNITGGSCDVSDFWCQNAANALNVNFALFNQASSGFNVISNWYWSLSPH